MRVNSMRVSIFSKNGCFLKNRKQRIVDKESVVNWSETKLTLKDFNFLEIES